MSISIHKELSYAIGSAESLADFGHLETGMFELERKLEWYDNEVITRGVKRHYPTYAKATAVLFSLKQVLSYESKLV